MSIVACPRCGDKVSVPPSASPSALVQCPLCLEEYYLSDALIQLPPMLVVVGGPSASADQETDLRLAGAVTAAIGQAALDSAAGAAPRPQLRTVARPRRPEKSAIGEIVKVVFGGAAGLAGGLLVLWWLFGVDVADLGPKLSKVAYLRFLVPQKLWDDSVRSDNGSAQLESVEQGERAQVNPKSGKSAGGNQFTGNSAKSGTERESGDDSGSPIKNAPQADPFLTLDDLGAQGTPPAGGGDNLVLDDPLSAVTPAAKNPSPRSEKVKRTEDLDPAESKKEETNSKPPAAAKEGPAETPPEESKSESDDSGAAKNGGSSGESLGNQPATEESKPARDNE